MNLVEEIAHGRETKRSGVKAGRSAGKTDAA